MRIIMLLSLVLFSSCSLISSLIYFKGERLPSTSWSNDIAYLLLVDKFADGNHKNNYNVKRGDPMSYEGGDLRGLIQNLDYFDQLGSSTILFTPIMDNRDKEFFGHFGAHGYWIIDHYRIDEHFGDDSDIKKFTDRRIANKKKLLVDLVLNHVDWDHPWIKNHPDWFNTLGTITDYNNDEQLIRGQLTGLPDLNQDREEVYAELLLYAKYWIDILRADGVRLDALKHIDTKFWRKFVKDIKEHVKDPNFLFLGELLHGDPLVYKKYIEAGVNGFFDYPLYYSIVDVFVHNKPLSVLSARLKMEARIFPSHVTLATFLDNHDMPRFLSLSDRVTIEDLHQALLFLMTIRGMPVILYGTESEMRGKTGELGRGFLERKKTATLTMLTQLQKLRQKHNSLSTGNQIEEIVTDSLYVYRKLGIKEESLVILRREKSSAKVFVDLPENTIFRKQKELVDQLSKRKYKVINGKIELNSSSKTSLLFILPTPETKSVVANPKVKLKIIANVGDLKKGERLFLTGNRDFLGNWSPKQGREFMREGRVHSVSIEGDYNDVVDCKLVRLTVHGDLIWEERDNRQLFFKSASNYHLNFNH